MYDFIIAERLRQLRATTTKEETVQLQLELPLILGDRPARDSVSEPIVLSMSEHPEKDEVSGVLILTL